MIYSIVVEDTPAQDLFFIEQSVEGTRVTEVATAGGTSSFGMPGLTEAVIEIFANGTVAVALAWITQRRASGRMILREKSEPSGESERTLLLEWNESEGSKEMIDKARHWMDS